MDGRLQRMQASFLCSKMSNPSDAKNSDIAVGSQHHAVRGLHTGAEPRHNAAYLAR